MWESFFLPSSSNATEMLISLPGTLLTLNIILITEIKNVSGLFTWVFNQSQPLFNVRGNEKYFIFTPIKYSYSSKTYFLLGNIPKFYYPNPDEIYDYFYYDILPENKDERHTTSWMEADEICSSIGAHLPFFRSRNELSEFLALVKDVPDIPPLEAVYIGLKYNINRLRGWWKQGSPLVFQKYNHYYYGKQGPLYECLLYGLNDNGFA